MKICPLCQKTYSDDVELCPYDGTPLTAQATETEAQLACQLSRRFRIIRRLGAGGMGAVFLAEQIAVGNRPVALKVLNRKLLDNPDFLLRFQNEAASTGRIHHPNVVTIHESGQADDGTPYIAMEFLEGESLREVLQRRGALPVTEVAEILQQAARGLNAAHKLGIIHRDLKPDNIFLTRGDENETIVKVVDFGIAKLAESGAHTQTGMVLGTPAYMSFEQASGMRSDELDARSDIYSLGVVTYEMLTGRTPFHSGTPVGFLRKHMMDEPPPFRTVKPDLPALAQLESVVMKALTKDRDQRHGSVLEFARDFVEAAAVDSQPAAKPQRQAPMMSAPKTMVPALAPDTATVQPVHLGARSSGRKRFAAGCLLFMLVVAALGLWHWATPKVKPERGQLGSAPAITVGAFALERTLTGHDDRVYSVAFSPNGKSLASGSQDKTIRVWDVASGTLRQTLMGHTDIVFSVAFSPDGRLLASGSPDKTIKLWDVASGRLNRTLTTHSGPVMSVAFSPDGKLLASGSQDKTIKLWDVASGTLRQTLTAHSGSVLSVAFSPDGKLLASGSYDNTVKLWDVKSRTLERTLTGDNWPVLSVAFSPDGKLLASGSNKTVKIWDVTSGILWRTLTGSGRAVTSVAISPEGKLVASGSLDNTIKLWNMISGTLTQTLGQPEPDLSDTDAAWSIAFSPDGKLLVSGNWDKTINLWRVAQ
jgi:WD40 repeat protein